MKIGDVIETTSFTALAGQKPRINRFTFKAPKGSRFVLLVLGMQADKNPPIDLKEALESLGWRLASEEPK